MCMECLSRKPEMLLSIKVNMFLENPRLIATFLHIQGMSVMKNHIRDNKKTKECVFVPRNRSIKYVRGVPQPWCFQVKEL